jgi:hypothetical protein
MTHRIVLLVLASSAVAHAQPDEAARQVREQLETRWQLVVDAKKSIGWRVELRSARYEGDWVVRLGSWTYLFARGRVRCRVQADIAVTCNGQDFVELAKARITYREKSRAPTFAELRALQRGIFGGGFAVTPDGKTTVETIVSSPPADTRTSSRYRAAATLTVRGFTVEEPRLVETYRERCFAVNGCHDTHWSCQRDRTSGADRTGD